MTSLNAQAINEVGRRQWEQKAAFWDALHGDEGSRFHRQLVTLEVERLIARMGQRPLSCVKFRRSWSAGCGKGECDERQRKTSPS